MSIAQRSTRQACLLLACWSILCQLFAQDWPNLHLGQFNCVEIDSIILYKLWYYSVHAIKITKPILFNRPRLTSLTAGTATSSCPDLRQVTVPATQFWREQPQHLDTGASMKMVSSLELSSSLLSRY